MSSESRRVYRANVFPEFLKTAFKALADEERQLVVSYILYRDGGPVTLSELKEKLSVDEEKLSKHLAELVDGYILRKVVVSAEGERTGYSLTRLAFNILSALARALKGHDFVRDEVRKYLEYTVYRPLLLSATIVSALTLASAVVRGDIMVAIPALFAFASTAASYLLRATGIVEKRVLDKLRSKS